MATAKWGQLVQRVRTLLAKRDGASWEIAAAVAEAIEAGRPGADEGVTERMLAFADAVGLAFSTVERYRSVALYWKKAMEIPPRGGVSIPWSVYVDLMPK